MAHAVQSKAWQNLTLSRNHVGAGEGIETDPGEEADLAAKLPGRLAAMRDVLLAYPHRKVIDLATDEDWDQFGGEVTRPPWAEGAIN